MDHWEAHFRVKAESDAIVARHALATFLQSKGESQTADDLSWLGKLWLEGDDD
jgi:hypothetical protein